MNRHPKVAQTDGSSFLQELLPALQRLDARLERAMQAAPQLLGAETARDLYRGLYVSAAEVERLLGRTPGEPTFGENGQGQHEPLPEQPGAASRLARLQATYDLTPFDLDVLLLALAPELDRRYERLYAYLQDHVSRRWPTVDLALDLLCADAVDRLHRRAHFDTQAPLLRHRLVHLLPAPEQPVQSLLSQTIQVDEQIVRFLLHQDMPDQRLAPFCRLVPATVEPERAPPESAVTQRLTTLLHHAWHTGHPLRLYLQGPDGVGKLRAVMSTAARLNAPVLVVAIDQMVVTPGALDQVLPLVFRYAGLYDCLLFLDGLHHWPSEPGRADTHLLGMLAAHSGIVVMAGTQPWSATPREPLGVLSLSFPMPDFAQRWAYWQLHLADHGSALQGAELDALAARFRLTAAQIAEATALAHKLAQRQIGTAAAPSVAEIFAAARAQSNQVLAALARKIEPIYTWQDIVLPADALTQLHELCERVAHRHQVLDTWGFDRRLSLGKGINALFAGPSGSGKTMAAEIIANELGLDLYKIDLSGIVSKYIGETEKNLDRVFNAAENANAILFFDEADALFGKRSEVSDAHDRYANIEISYLLQKMEEYDGIAILATNLRQNLDEAFIRRLTFAIHFPFPDAEQRRSIWAGIWPPETPLSGDVDLALLAERLKLSGGNIKNIALAAAFLAAEAQSIITMAHVLHAIKREHQKMGKIVSDAELMAAVQATDESAP